VLKVDAECLRGLAIGQGVGLELLKKALGFVYRRAWIFEDARHNEEGRLYRRPCGDR
jgi:hypothetical protein